MSELWYVVGRPANAVGDIDELLDEFTKKVGSNLAAIGVQLQAKNRDFWDTYDRKTAESDFPLAMSPAIAFIVVILAHQTTPLLLGFLLVPLRLCVPSVRLRVASVSTWCKAVVPGIVDPPVFAAVEADIQRKRQKAPGR